MLELDARDLSYETFCKLCLKPNRPAVIRHADTALDTTGRLAEQLSPAGLARVLDPNTHRVPVYKVDTQGCQTSHSNSNGEGKEAEDKAATPGCTMETLSDVWQSWVQASMSLHETTQEPTCLSLLYLKDWHMQSDLERAWQARDRKARQSSSTPTTVDDCCDSSCAHEGRLYTVPRFLGPDWMQPFCAHVAQHDQVRGFGDGKSDYRFAYIGVQGTWTALHYDVFGTYSWSYNVCGDKLWFFPTPAGNAYLQHTLPYGYPTPPDIRVLTGFDIDTVVQRAGDLVFVPAQYYHQVHNIRGESFILPGDSLDASTEADTSEPTMRLTIAVNHNWCNQFCLDVMLRLFLHDAAALRRWLGEADMLAAFGPDRTTWPAQMDDMLHGGTNWSVAAMRSFLHFVRERPNLAGEGAIAGPSWPSVEAQVTHAIVSLQ